MKHTILSVLLLFLALSSSAQLSGDGFYRLQNRYTQRYVRLRDGYGRVNLQTTSADMSAVQTIKPYDDSLSDPASVFYIKSVPSASGYDLFCQGTSLHSVIGYYVKMSVNGEYYQPYAQYESFMVYLADDANASSDESSLTKFVLRSMDAKQIDWSLHPVNMDEGHYLGVIPSIYCALNGKHYTSYYTFFPYSSSPGMKAYYVNKVDAGRGIVVYQEISTSDVPAATPVFLECTSQSVFDNKLDVHTSSEVSPSDNLLKGVYFCRVMKSSTNPHNFNVKNDTSTIRVLGLRADGTLGYIVSGDEYLSENSSYLVVPANSPVEFTLMTQKEYDTATEVQVTSSEVAGVRYFDLMGQELLTPQNGVTVVVTTYKDGRVTMEKVLYRQ